MKITREKMREIAVGCEKCKGSGEIVKYTSTGRYFDAVACQCVRGLLK